MALRRAFLKALGGLGTPWQHAAVLLNRFERHFSNRRAGAKAMTALASSRCIAWKGASSCRELVFQIRTGGPEAPDILKKYYGLDLAPGRMVAVRRPVAAAAKPPLIKLIAGLLEPTEGNDLFSTMSI